MPDGATTEGEEAFEYLGSDLPLSFPCLVPSVEEEERGG